MDNGDEIKMTRADLYDWLKLHGCTFNPIEEYKAHVIKVDNPRNGNTYWLNLPINDYLVRDYTVYRTCMSLGVPIPNHATYMEDMQNRIEEEDKIPFL